jgi:hypothetical protein
VAETELNFHAVLRRKTARALAAAPLHVLEPYFAGTHTMSKINFHWAPRPAGLCFALAGAVLAVDEQNAANAAIAIEPGSGLSLSTSVDARACT